MDLNHLKERIEFTPKTFGVYIFKDQRGRVLYVGKSRSLKNRLQHYLSPPFDYKSEQILQNLRDFDYIVTNSEVEALILEANLIKQYKPPYNILFRDDKNYPYLRLSVNEKYPRLNICRRVFDDGAKYFGPFRSARALRDTLRIVSRVFKLRSCKKSIIPGKTSLCLDFHLQKCSGPCINAIDEENYRLLVDEVVTFLEGRSLLVIEELRKKMFSAAEALKFEEARIYRDRLKKVEEIWERQKVVLSQPLDADVIALEKGGKLAVGIIFLLRSGKIIGQRNLTFKINEETTTEEIYSSLITQYYRFDSCVPPEIIFPQKLFNKELIRIYLEKIRKNKIVLTCRPCGEKKEVLQLALSNAKLILDEKNSSLPQFKKIKELKKNLGLKKYPRRIEAFDISSFGRKDMVASKVAFLNGEKDTSNYRKYKISFSDKIDDYGALEEVITRRFKRLIAEKEIPPDLVIIDGGRGHLNRTKKALRNLGAFDFDIISIAKGEEKIYFPTQKPPLKLSKTSPALILLQRIRDEAHRFAISYQRLLRRKDLFIFIFTLIFFFFSSYGFAASDLKSKEEELKKIYSELKEKKIKLWQTKQKEKHALSDLYYVRKQLRQTHGELLQTRNKLVHHQQGITILKDKLFKNQGHLELQLGLLAERIAEIYKSGALDYLEVIFSSVNTSDFLSRSLYFEKILETDLDLIGSIKEQIAKINQQKNVLTVKKNQTQVLAKKIEEKEDFVKVQEKIKDRVLDDLRRKRIEYEKMVRELEENSREIESMIKRLLAQRRREKGEEPHGTGILSWPLRGSIRSYFGYRRHPIFRSVRFHTGIDIDASYGTAIAAADAGKVIFSGWWGGYGKAVIIDHGKGISTVYAHLSRFNVNEGNTVSKGDIIGRVGSTGYSTGPHLHFEVRVEGTPVNPMKYL